MRRRQMPLAHRGHACQGLRYTLHQMVLLVFHHWCRGVILIWQRPGLLVRRGTIAEVP